MKKGNNGMKTTRRTGIIQDPRYAGHCMEVDHPECPERLGVIYRMLEKIRSEGLFTDIVPRRAKKDELLRVHSPAHIRRMEDTEGKPGVYLDTDTITAPLSHEAALLAAGGLCLAVEQVWKGDLDNAFALVRPPGHHAEKNRPKGFCLYNNVAVAARYALDTLGIRRVLIVDWDLHHGNGTQHCFEKSSEVLFFSVHRDGAYPGTGTWRELGKGAGKGYTLNIPLPAGLGDGEYTVLFEKILRPVALEFQPQFVLVSAGFDIHHQDPLGEMKVTPRGFAALTRSVLQIADTTCHGKIVLTLEGGYDLEGLRDSVEGVLREMAGVQHTDPKTLMTDEDIQKMSRILWRTRNRYSKYWNSLASMSVDKIQQAPSMWERIRERLSL
jgi:acetoin utilization deacetylase AcuC-like enzyme